jgi:4-hydroxybenzoate polyprenyltransferase
VSRLDPLVFSSAWVAAAALALTLVSGAAMGGWPDAAVLGLVFCGTLFVYNVDRLRDLPRDRETSPARSTFVERHRRALLVLCIAAGIAAGPLALEVGEEAALLLLPVLLAGLFHRRLKRFAWWKPVYVSAAWTLVVVGLPALTLPHPHRIAWVGGLIGATMLANVIASNLRDGEGLSLRLGPRVPLRMARALALAALLVGVLGPASVRPLVWIPLATALALAFFRADEHYGLVVVDGALLLGSLLALPGYLV